MTVNPDLRVAFVTPSWARGWRAQPVFHEFVKLFPRTVVFTGFWPGFTTGYEGAFEVRPLRGVRGIARDERTAKGFIWVSPRNLWALLRFRPQVIFTNGFHLCAAYALLLKLLLGTRVILLWQGVSAETGGAPGSLRLWLRRRMARFFDLAISNTAAGIDYLQDRAGFPADRLWHEICEVADRQSFTASPAPDTSPAQAERPVFLFVGRTIREKGLPVLLEAASLLVNRGLRHFSLVIVGDGADRAELEQMARRLGIEDRLRWEGFVAYQHMGTYYQAGDVAILPSLEDTWGIVVAEAMLFGKPVLCSQQAGVRELVQHGVNGFLFDPRQPQQLADYMSRFIQRPELIARLGAASAEIISHYSPRRTAEIFAAAVRIVTHDPAVLVAGHADKTCSTIASR